MKDTSIAAYETQGLDILTHAESIMVVDDTTRELAAEFTTKARKAIKAIKAEFKDDIQSAHELHKSLLSRQKKLVEPFELAHITVDKEIRRDYLEQEGIQRRAKHEEQVRVDAERRKQEVALAEEAERLIDEGRMEAAEEIVDTEVVVAPVLPVPEVRKTMQSSAGSTTVKKDIRVEVVDKVAVIEAVAKRELPVTLLTVDVGAAKRFAKVSGLMEMAGFRITEDAVVSGRVR